MSSEALQVPVGEVVLPEGESALELLHRQLVSALEAFPEALESAGIPRELKTFRKSYPDALARFEAARLASSERLGIATHMTKEFAAAIQWQDGRGRQGLDEFLLGSDAPAPVRMAVQTHRFNGAPGWRPSITYRGKRYAGLEIKALANLLVERRVASSDAGQSLVWLLQEAMTNESLDLSGRKIAVLGGGAEMAPTRFWLEAGADVFWIDTRPPPTEWFDDELAGSLSWIDGNADLLTQPRELLATLTEFAAGDPLDLGLYAYAPGRAREIRLTAVMNALVNALPREMIASVTILVSPTTPTSLDAAGLKAMQAHYSERAIWERVVAKIGLLGRGGGAACSGEAAATRTVVSIQGASYQAAQYLGKILMAETWATRGLLAQGVTEPVRVSANTAAITRTRSLDHPVFTAAFGGAAALGVETMTPRQSRRLNGLLAASDWLQADLPVPGAVRIHGGIHSLPYPLESALRIAAAIGFARAPRLLKGLFGG